MSTNTLQFLTGKFAPASAITRTQFREFLGIAPSTDWRAFKTGRYPRVIHVGGHDRILLTDLAEFLNQTFEKPVGKKCGRPRRYATPSELLETLGV